MIHPASSSPFSSGARNLRGVACSLALGAGLAGCAGESLSLGANESSESAPEVSVCPGGFTGDVVANRQEDIDALRGCEEVFGNVYINAPLFRPRADFNLDALTSLRIVHGALTIVGAPTLAGLEALEQVESLDLAGLKTPDLSAFESLTRVAWDPAGGGYSGTLTVRGCQELQDLSGLEGIELLSGLRVYGNDSLASLAGLRPPPFMQTIDIQRSPALRDISALAPVRRVDQLLLWETGIDNLDGFELEQAQELWIESSPAIANLDGLAHLKLLQSLRIVNDAGLRRIDLPALEEVNWISVTDNLLLEAVPRYNAGLAGSYDVGPSSGVGKTSVTVPHGLFEVGNNAALTHIVMPLGYELVGQVEIWGNAKLVELDLNFLERSDGLVIEDNPLLATVAAGLLQRVGDLTMLNNPALSVAPFAAVQTFTRAVSGNLDGDAP